MMSNPDPIRIKARPESRAQADQMIAHHTAGAHQLIGGAVIGFPVGATLEMWPFAWPAAGGAEAVRRAASAHHTPDGTDRADIAIATAWTCLRFDRPYPTALARVTITFQDLPGTPSVAFWIDARRHRRLLQPMVQHRRLMIFATKPLLAALSDPERLAALAGISLTFEPDLRVVQELLDEMGT
jgi:hypothetical protein